MSTRLRSLERFREDVTGEKMNPGASWQPPEPKKMRVLGIDQSLAATGWAMLVDGVVIDTGMLKTESIEGLKGVGENLARGEEIFVNMFSVLYEHEPEIVVHETPPQGNPKLQRPDASLIAAMAVRCAVRAYEKARIAMVGTQRVKKRMTGNGNADKSEVREAILRMMPTLPDECKQRKSPLNNNVYDAVGLAIVGAEEV